jgi:hypothetical protein
MSRQVWIRVCAAAAASVVVAATAVAFADGGERFRVRDDCDPTTFNLAVPSPPGAPPTCNPAFDGDTTFQEFIANVTENQADDHWRFQPDRTTVDRGESTTIESRAGETHTFTRVAAFGGGFISLLNDLSGAGAARPECGVADTATTPPMPNPPSATNIFVTTGKTLDGPSGGSAALPKGTTKWQCCIHPWMRSTITVR